MFIQTEETPNPATMKFLPGREVMEQGTLDMTSPKDALRSPLAQSLFEIEGVRAVFFGADFIAVTKAEDKAWPGLKPAILTAIMEHYTSGKPILDDTVSGEAEAGDEDPVVAQIRDLLDHRIRPAVAQDGGDIVFQRFEDGIVYLTLKGACAGCPSATLTLKAGVESLLRHYIPEVREVRQVSPGNV
ncbi:MAG: NifU family protein [Alphaproteobacteria bacterium]|nr:NifU family protein [Alphaproteobacteria bacterium]